MATYEKLGTPKFVADEGSVMLHGTGVQINWDAVAADGAGRKRLAAGTVLKLNGSGQAEPDNDSADAVGLLVSDVDMELGQNKGFHGMYIGGHFYENLLPGVPTATQKGGLGARFAFIEYNDSRLD